MKLEFYTDKGFQEYGTMEPSEKYARGIDFRYPENRIVGEGIPSVYLLVNSESEVLKIGETQNLNGRMMAYRHIRNTTNDRIRAHVKTVGDLKVYVFQMKLHSYEVLGYNCKTSYTKGLESALLEEWIEENNNLPLLNACKK